MTKTLWLDIETYSSVDLAKAGVYKYAESEDFQVLLFAYAYDDEPVTVLDLTKGGLPWRIAQDLRDPDVIKKAHNAAFERVCLSWYLYRKYWSVVGNPFQYLDPAGWYCTMVHSSMCGLPQSLKQVGDALELAEDQQKLATGKALIKEFCVPCKPTKTNGGRTRNLPEHDPDGWQTFIRYNKQDVVTEIAIEKRLEEIYPMPQLELERYWTDQRINDTGIRTDMGMVDSILRYGAGHNEAIKEAAQTLAGINVGSPTQIKAWLQDRAGITADKLDKDTLLKLIASTSLTDVQELLRLRMEYGKTSNKKYQVIQTGTCQDGRMHGILQFYGSRTGRWAGRLLQPQNLPRNAFEDFHDARKLVKDENWELLEMCYPSPNDVFSTLIRTALIPADGMAFAVADYSAIEARVIAWLADEKWRLDAFHSGRDIYCESAAMMFKVPVEKHGVNGHLRKQGKVAELACIAKGQRVLTDVGLVPIERVTAQMKVWDGKEWVSHDGVIYKGRRNVIEHDGLKATPDHMVYIEGKTQPVRFDESTRGNACYTMSGDGGRALRLSGDNQSREKMEASGKTWMESSLCTCSVPRMRRNQMDPEVKSDERKIQGMSALQSTKKSPCLASEKVHGSQTEVYQPQRRKLQELRGPGDQVQLSHSTGCLSVYAGDLWSARQKHGTGQDRLERELRTRESSLGDQGTESGESSSFNNPGLGSKGMALCKKCGHPEAVSWNDPGGDHRGSEGCSEKQKEKLAGYSEETDVYDILNAGPRHRYTVEGHLVHNCGYGGGVGALLAFHADEMGLSKTEMQDIVDKWRKASPRICQLWKTLDRMVSRAMAGAVAKGPKGMKASMGDGCLRIKLPSGRLLIYQNPRYEMNPKQGRDNLAFDGLNQTTHKWETIFTFGGKLVENVVQAIARDCLAVTIDRMQQYAPEARILMHVHDEIIVEVPSDEREDWLRKILDVMAQSIGWAPGLELKGAGFTADYYMKD